MPKAMVLGHPALARRIAKDLEDLGFVCDLAPAPEHGDLEATLRRWRELGVTCVHPGTGSWAEKPELPQLCQTLGMECVTPASKILSLFANKLSLLSEAEAAGIPTLVQGNEPLSSVREIEQFIASKGNRYPIILKAIRGGAGFGVQILRSHQDLEKKLPLWLEQLARVYGEAIVFPETYLESCKRIIAPFARFRDGKIVCFSKIDSSLQHLFRRLVDFCPARTLAQETHDEIDHYTRTFTEKVGYVGVGALEYFIDADRVFMINGACRLNHGFHLWEAADQTSGVAWQLATLGILRDIPSPPLKGSLHSMGVRIYCEDPVLQLPQPGQVAEMGEAKVWKIGKANVELDLAVNAGDTVPPPEDGLLGILVGSAPEKHVLEVACLKALEEVWIAGAIQTNERFLRELLMHPFVKAGMIHAGFVDEDFIPRLRPSKEIFSLFAGVCVSAFGQVIAIARTAPSKWIVGDQWVKPQDAKVEWCVPARVQEQQEGFSASGVLLDPVRGAAGEKLRVCIWPLSANRWQVRIGEWVFSVRQVLGAKTVSGDSVALYAQTSGVLHSILYKEGSVVEGHDALVVIESLRTLIPHAVPIKCKIKSWHFESGTYVKMGQELAILERVE